MFSKLGFKLKKKHKGNVIFSKYQNLLLSDDRFAIGAQQTNIQTFSLKASPVVKE